MAAKESQYDMLQIGLLRNDISRRADEGEFAIKNYYGNGNNNLHNAVLLSNVEACLLESENFNINDVNIKGETPLHLAAMNSSLEGASVIDILLAKGASVNKQNKWGQTPLHYAAIADCFQNLEKLATVPAVDVNIVDVNGYNALHCLISYREAPGIDGLEDFEEVEELNPNLKRAIHLLIDTGTNVNRQTSFGYTILYLASAREDNTPLVRYILSTFPGIDLRAKNQIGENFLHIYTATEIFEEVSDTLDEIAELSLPVINELLSDRDVFGKTPWGNMLDNANISEDVIQKIWSYGVSAQTADNLGNTAMHRFAGSSNILMFPEFIDLLIQGGADIDAENVYGETAVFFLYLRGVFDVFSRYKMDFNKNDRWGRIPLVSIMKHRPFPDLLSKLIEDGKADVNAKDIYGSTPLHFAVYHNFPEQVELLLKHGADQNAVDSLHDRPLDTCRRHCSFRCHLILEKEDRTGMELTQKSTFEQILLNMPSTITSSSITSAQVVQTVLGLKGKLDGFVEHLMAIHYFRQEEVAIEFEAVAKEVNSLVSSLCQKIGSYDTRFEMSLLPTGSSAEGTKVGRPDEFDFVLCLDSLTNNSDIEIAEDCRDTGYACLRFSEVPLSKEYLMFCDADGYFMAQPFLRYFLIYLKRALHEADLWASGNLYYNFEDKLKVNHNKPVFSFSIYWNGSAYKQLKISIDLVPVVYKRGWWPPNIITEDISLMNKDVMDAGCFLMLQTRGQDFSETKDHLNDCISHTCNILKYDKKDGKKRMLRISSTPAEIALMKSLPEKFRHAYALAKILKAKEVCPEIEIDEPPTNLYSRLKKFQSEKPLPVKPSTVIKSYMLKNCTFYLFQEMCLSSEQNYSELNIAEIAAKVYEHLLIFADDRLLKPYFLPFSDVFEFEKEHPKSSYKDFVLRLEREFSIKLVLGILDHPFPENIMSL